MGRQVNFFLNPQDMLELIGRVQRKIPLVIFRRQSPDNQPIVVSEHEFQRLDEIDYGLCITSPDLLDSVRFRYVPEQEYFYFDVLHSLAIEFGQCKVNNGKLSRGRLYYVAWYYADNGEKVEKDPLFIKWAQSVLRMAMKGLSRDPDSGFYIGPHAERLYTEGKIELAN